MGVKSRVKRIRERKGALTIEACISYSIFLMVIVTMLYIMRIVYVYGLVQHAVSQTAKELSMYTYLYQVSGMNDLRQDVQGSTQGRTDQFNADAQDVVDLYKVFESGNYQGETYDGTTDPTEILKNIGAALLNQAAGEINNQAFTAVVRPMIGGYIGSDSKGNSANDRLESLRVIGGLNGLDLSSSSFFEDGATIDLIVCYTIDPMFPIDIMPNMNLMNRACVRGMSGKSVFSSSGSSNASKEGSPWELSNDLERGEVIQNQENIRNLPDNFSVYSAFDSDTGKATAECSMDLREDTYQTKQGIVNNLRKKCNKMENYRKSTYDGVTLDPEDIKSRELIIYIPSSKGEREIDRSLYDEAVKEVQEYYPDITIRTKEID